MIYLFFFFKQKTAYEMRISDWSSDVCSSDLGRRRGARQPRARLCARGSGDRYAGADRDAAFPDLARRSRGAAGAARRRRARRARRYGRAPLTERRSEEHTSELQSLMRISYAVFCLKKKKATQTTPTRLKHDKQSNQLKTNT